MSITGTASFDSARSSAPFRVRIAGLARTTSMRALRGALPQACTLCAARCGDALVCADCAAALPYLPPACPVCALPTAGAQLCGACVAKTPPFAATVAPLVYAFPVDRLMQDLKYRGRLALADWAAAVLAAATLDFTRAVNGFVHDRIAFIRNC